MFHFDELEEKRRRRIKQFVDLCQRYVAEFERYGDMEPIPAERDVISAHCFGIDRRI